MPDMGIGETMLIATAAATAGSVLSADASRSAANTAADAQANAAKTSADVQLKLGEEALSLQKPFYEAAYPLLPYQTQAGLQAYQQTLPQMESIATDYKTSPLTNLQLQGTTDQINNALSARGLYNSGAGVQAISQASQGILASEADKKWNRLQSLYGLQTGNTAAVGASAATSSGNLASNLGTGLANTYMTGAANQISPLLYGAQSTANMYSSMGGLGMGLAQGYMQNQTTQDYLNTMGLASDWSTWSGK